MFRFFRSTVLDKLKVERDTSYWDESVVFFYFQYDVTIHIKLLYQHSLLISILVLVVSEHVVLDEIIYLSIPPL